MIERERKFLIKHLPDGCGEGLAIMQAYLMLDREAGRQLRVRVTGDNNSGVRKGFICYKSNISLTDRNEYEYEIPYGDALDLTVSAEVKLFKTRYRLYWKEKHLWLDIDVYPNGKMVCEIEYTGELTSIPDFCGEEVTGQKEWSNIEMALNGTWK